jgi:glycosyltransferase involved in cell wall biosynthesis
MSRPERIALVHDWLVRMRGGEKVLEALCECYPNAEIFTLVHKRGSVSPSIEAHRIHTSFVQLLPGGTSHYQYYLPILPLAIESLRLKGFNCAISVSASVAKAAPVPSDTLHVCYCNTPMRYIWDQFGEYFGHGRAGAPTRIAMSMLRPILQRWDVRTASRPHWYVANSRNIQRRIERIYHRTAEVIYPPVDTQQFVLSRRDEGYYLVVSALVPYKRIDLAVQAATKTGERLIVVGEGEELEHLRAVAGPTVEFTGWKSNEEIRNYYAGCRALLFPGEEDFGIVPVEAMATGKPVVAFARGGALETVLESPELRTGVLFHRQTVDDLVGALRKVRETEFDGARMRDFALRFDTEVFKSCIMAYVGDRLSEFRGEKSTSPEIGMP